jgi:hypothetical protein
MIAHANNDGHCFDILRFGRSVSLSPPFPRLDFAVFQGLSFHTSFLLYYYPRVARNSFAFRQHEGPKIVSEKGFAVWKEKCRSNSRCQVALPPLQQLLQCSCMVDSFNTQSPFQIRAQPIAIAIVTLKIIIFHEARARTSGRMRVWRKALGPSSIITCNITSLADHSDTPLLWQIMRAAPCD